MDMSRQKLQMIPELKQGSEDHEIGVKQEPRTLEELAEANLEHEEVPCIEETIDRKYPCRERKTPAYCNFVGDGLNNKAESNSDDKYSSFGMAKKVANQ